MGKPRTDFGSRGSSPGRQKNENERSRWQKEKITMRTVSLAIMITLGLLLNPLPPDTRAATITVTSTADSGPGSLRAALASASNGDQIEFSVTGVIALTTGELIISNSVDVIGPGPAHLAVDAAAASRVLTLTNAATVSISGLTVTNGNVFGSGGGILNDHATLTISNCIVSGNTANNGGGIYSNGRSGSATLVIVDSILNANSAGNGGGVYNDGVTGNATLTVSNSMLGANSAGNGAGIFNDGRSGGATLRIVNSTLAANSTGNGGGAIYNFGANGGSATASVANCTLSGNSADSGGAIFNDGRSGSATLAIASSTLSSNSATTAGGGIVNFPSDGTATVEIGNTILNAGASGANITNFNSGTVTSRGYNLSSDDAGGLLTGTADQVNTNPQLGPLQDNGGPTLTHALLPASPAIDQGKHDTIAALASDTDQRGPGFVRPCDDPNVPNAPGGDGSDIGAFELQGVCNRPPVAQCQDVVASADANCEAAASVDDGSFDPDGDPITLSQEPPGPYALGATPVTLTVVDSHSASNSCSATVTVVDDTPPQIICPADIVTNAATPAGVTVSFAPVASDNCSIASVTSAPASGSVFPIGTTTVTCRAIDGAGLTNTCTFTVRVNAATGDSDGDGVPDDIDQCPDTPPGAIVNASGCSIGQLVPCEGPATGGNWKNHGTYVQNVVKIATEFRRAGLITQNDWTEFVKAAALSGCGTKSR
jgi:hypothetical protein